MTAAPICVMSFNRPDYLERVLESIEAQRDLKGRDIFLFQDGSWSPTMNRYHADAGLIDRSISLFKNKFPKGQIFDSAVNLGVALNFDRAEKHVFETLQCPAAIFCEDDLILGPSYLTVLERLIDEALSDERIGYVASFGNYKVDAEMQRQKANQFLPLHLLWGFGLTRRHWLKCRPYVLQYLDLVRDVDYRQRDNEKIHALCQSWGVKLGDTAQDRIKSFVTALVGATKINTQAAYAKYIGKSGLNFTPEVFAKWGFEGNEFFNDPITLDFDFSSVNFDPWFVGNNVWKIEDQTDESKTERAQMLSAKATRSDVVMAYRLFLAREPESEEVVKARADKITLDALRQSFLNSAEFTNGRAHLLEPTAFKETKIKPLMTNAEQQLFTNFVNCSQRYLEFGSGGSTQLAAATKKQWLITIDSSREWLDNVVENTMDGPTLPETVFVDIGPIGAFGTPIDLAARDRWPTYHEAVWRRPESNKADMIFIDGRFRVACAIQSAIHCSPDAFIAIHDFDNRPHYHVVKRFLRKVASVEQLSVFVRSASFDVEDAIRTLEKYRYNPD
jgi:hypothetical protein